MTNAITKIEDSPKTLAMANAAADRMVEAGAFPAIIAENVETATELVGNMKKEARALDKQRRELVKPLNDVVNKINGAVNPRIKGLEAEAKALGTRVADFLEECERIAERERQAAAKAERQKQTEAARLAREATEAEEAAAEGAETEEEAQELAETAQSAKTAAVAAAVDQALAAPVPSQVKIEPVRTEAGSGSKRTIWKWEVEDLSLVPDKYKKIDDGAVTKVVKAGKDKTKIPGIRVYSENILASS